MHALELVALLPRADILRDAVIGERALGRRAFALAGADGQRVGGDGTRQNGDTLERAAHSAPKGEQAEAIRKRDLRNADREHADMRTGE